MTDTSIIYGSNASGRRNAIHTAQAAGKTAILYDNGWQYMKLTRPAYSPTTQRRAIIRASWERTGAPATHADSSWLISRLTALASVVYGQPPPAKLGEWYNVEHGLGPGVTERMALTAVGSPQAWLWQNQYLDKHEPTYDGEGNYAGHQWNTLGFLHFHLPYGMFITETPPRNPAEWETEGFSVIRNETYTGFPVAEYATGNGWWEDGEDYPRGYGHLRQFGKFYEGDPFLKKQGIPNALCLLAYPSVPSPGPPGNFAFPTDPNVDDYPDRQEANHVNYDDWGTPFEAIAVKYKRRTA